MSDDDDIAGKDGDHIAAAEYALGVLPEPEREALRARLGSEPALRAALGFWRRRLSSLDGEFAESPVPPEVWSGIERRLFPSAGTASIWSSLGLWRGLAATMAAVAVIAIGVNVMAPRPDPSAFAVQLVAALSAQGSNVQVVALYNAQSGEVRITPISGNAVPGKDYELWAIEGQSPAKSLGVIPIDVHKDVTIKPEILAGFGPGTTLAITLEQTGGSPTGKAQGPIVAAGKATPI